MVLAAVDDFQADTQGLHHGRPRTAQVMRSPVAVLAVGKDQGIVIAPSGEGLAVFEPSLAIADLFIWRAVSEHSGFRDAGAIDQSAGQ